MIRLGNIQEKVTPFELIQEYVELAQAETGGVILTDWKGWSSGDDG